MAFPIEEISVTFTEWTIEDASQEDRDVVTVKYTVRNIDDAILATGFFP